jgi:hypothetical protein
MADDIPFANGAGPAPRRRRMYAAPFGALQMDAPSIQYGNGSVGPTQGGINALAAQPVRPIAAPFGTLPTPTYDPPPSSEPMPYAPAADLSEPPEPEGWAQARALGLDIPFMRASRVRVPSVYDPQPSPAPPEDNTAAAPARQSTIPTDSINALIRAFRRR